MYTVARFIGKKVEPSVLTEIQKHLKQRMPSTFESDQGKNHLSCSISRSASWKDHESAAMIFLTQCSEIIRSAIKRGLVVQFDIALQPEDYEGRLLYCVTFSDSFLEHAYKHKIRIEFSLYLLKRLKLPLLKSGQKLQGQSHGN